MAPTPVPERRTTAAPFCSRLRTKKSYFLDGPARAAEELMDASGHCWCAETQQSVGPDGDVVHPEDCTAPRSCFVPPFPQA